MAHAYAAVYTVARVELAAIAKVSPRARARCGGAVGSACSLRAAIMKARVHLVALATLPATRTPARVLRAARLVGHSIAAPVGATVDLVADVHGAGHASIPWLTHTAPVYT